jgi:hypothetical protein
VQDEQDGSAEVRRQPADEFLQSLDATGRGADHDNFRMTQNFSSFFSKREADQLCARLLLLQNFYLRS